MDIASTSWSFRRYREAKAIVQSLCVTLQEIEQRWCKSRGYGYVEDHNCLEPGQFTLISMEQIMYSCGHISVPHELIPTKFGLWMFFIMLHWYGIQNAEMQKKVFCDVIASVPYTRGEGLLNFHFGIDVRPKGPQMGA